MIRNGAGRFAGNPLWADGWGWAMFIADDPARNVATSGDADCKACPIPAAASERVFVQGYPTLGKR